MKNKKGMTLVEICMVIVLLSLLSFSVINVFGLTSKAKEGVGSRIELAQSEAMFLDSLTSAIRTSTTQFTMPKNSFTEAKLTAGWDYIGIMENVHVPAAASATGKEIASTRALVYVQYYGDTEPTNLPADCNKIHNEDGWFIQKILGHDYTDSNGVSYVYTLVFNPTDPVNLAAQTVTYDFKIEMKDSSGNVLGEGPISSLDNLIATVNSIQIVYRGSATNPATAIAFRSDYIPSGVDIDKGQTERPSTIFMILDVSGSMADYTERVWVEDDNGGGGGYWWWPWGGGGHGGHYEDVYVYKITKLRNSANNFVTKISGRNSVNLVVIPFSSKASVSTYGYAYGKSVDKAKTQISGLTANGGTNTGGSFRVAYYIAKQLEAQGKLGEVVTIFISDGATTARDVLKQNNHSEGSTRDKCQSLTEDNSYYGGSYTYCGGASKEQKDIDYLQYWGSRFKRYMNLSLSFFVDVNGGMEQADKNDLYNVFGVDVVDVDTAESSQFTFDDFFDKIVGNLEDYLWAFDGPKQ